MATHATAKQVSAAHKLPSAPAGAAPTADLPDPGDLELAALIASKICHDVIGPIGAIGNGFQILDEDKDEDSRAYALDIIRNTAEQASAKLQFARFAYGAAGSQGATIDLTTAEQISRGIVEQGKHKLAWKGPVGAMPKDRVKLLLNMVAAAITALPRGGDLAVTIAGTLEAPSFSVLCRGQGARPPHHLVEFLTGQMTQTLEALMIQPYYTCRLAKQSGMRLVVTKTGADIVLDATLA